MRLRWVFTWRVATYIIQSKLGGSYHKVPTVVIMVEVGCFWSTNCRARNGNKGESIAQTKETRGCHGDKSELAVCPNS